MVLLLSGDIETNPGPTNIKFAHYVVCSIWVNIKELFVNVAIYLHQRKAAMQSVSI